MSCSQYAAAVAPLARQAGTCFFLRREKAPDDALACERGAMGLL